jgi:hypothetical protein
MARRLLLSALVALALADASARGATPSHPVPHGYRVHAIREAGVTVALPIGWQVLGQHDAAFPGALENLGRLDRSFVRLVGALTSPDSPLKLFAFDRVFWHHRATTAMVSQATYGRPGAYGRWAGRMARDLRDAPGRIGRIRASRVELPAGPALRAVYRTSTRDTITIYVVAARGGLWALIFRTPTALAAHRAPGFARAAATLALTEPLGGLVRRPSPPPAA